MSNYDFSEAANLFDMTQAAMDAGHGNAGMDVFGDANASTIPMDDPANAVGDADFATWLMQSDPDFARSIGLGLDVNNFGQTAEDGVLSSISKAWNGLGPAGQMLLGGAAAGGLSTYLQNRQRDKELASMGQMSEEQFNRALTLKRAPTNKVADVNHFQGLVKSLRGKQ